MNNEWLSKSYKVGSWPTGQKSKCRVCEGEIVFITPSEPDHRRSHRLRGAWVHQGFTYETLNDQVHYPEPTDFCVWEVSSRDYSYCGRPIKYEDKSGSHYACGIHMHKQLEREKEVRRVQERTEARKIEEEMTAFEAERYWEATKWLKENGYQSLIGDYEPTGHYRSLQRTKSIDVYKMYRAIHPDIREVGNAESRDANSGFNYSPI